MLNDVKKYFLLFDDVIAMPEGIAATFWGDPEIDLEVMALALADSDTGKVEKYRSIYQERNKPCSPLKQQKIM